MDAAKAQWEKSLELDPKNVALAKKFKDAGFGEPPSANTVPDEVQKIINKAQTTPKGIHK
jgi:hypothetical protein